MYLTCKDGAAILEALGTLYQPVGCETIGVSVRRDPHRQTFFIAWRYNAHKPEQEYVDAFLREFPRVELIEQQHGMIFFHIRSSDQLSLL